MRICRYFEGGVSSVFLWDLDDGGFAGVVLLKKSAYIFIIFSIREIATIDSFRYRQPATAGLTW
jgi:F-actin capping protein, beta subunit